MSVDELMIVFDSVDLSECDSEQAVSTLARMAGNVGAPNDIALDAIRMKLKSLGFVPIPFSDAQLLEYLGWASSRNQQSFTNYSIEVVKGKKRKVPLTMRGIFDRWQQTTGGWPRRIGNLPFVHDEYGLITFAQHQTASIMGYIRHHVGHVEWLNGPGYVSEAEFCAELKRVAKNYSTIEELPHEPRIPGIYYACKAPEPGDGTHLERLLNFYCPATPHDRELIKAKILSDFAGLPPGTKPVFVFTSDEGCGVGKTKCAETTADIAGGVIAVSAGDSMAEIKKRLLSSEAQTKRTVLIDNIKSDKFSWADLESLTTAHTISGHRMYCGEGERPNTLSYVLTLNGVSLGEDMSQRCVVIKLVRGQYSGTWYEDITRFINEHREQIIADIIGALRAEPKALGQYSRGGLWEHHILSKVNNPEAVQALILERQGEANADRLEADIIEDYFADQLAANGFDPQTQQVRIPVRTVAEWFNAATNERTKTQTVTRRLKSMADSGQIRRIRQDASRRHGRCFVWTGPEADVLQQLVTFESNHAWSEST